MTLRGAPVADAVLTVLKQALVEGLCLCRRELAARPCVKGRQCGGCLALAPLHVCFCVPHKALRAQRPVHVHAAVLQAASSVDSLHPHFSSMYATSALQRAGGTAVNPRHDHSRMTTSRPDVQSIGIPCSALYHHCCMHAPYLSPLPSGGRTSMGPDLNTARTFFGPVSCSSLCSSSGRQAVSSTTESCSGDLLGTRRAPAFIEACSGAALKVCCCRASSPSVLHTVCSA